MKQERLFGDDEEEFAPPPPPKIRHCPECRKELAWHFVEASDGTCVLPENSFWLADCACGMTMEKRNKD